MKKVTFGFMLHICFILITFSTPPPTHIPLKFSDAWMLITYFIIFIMNITIKIIT